MNKKISQFELTTKLQEQDLITLVQDGSNKILLVEALLHHYQVHLLLMRE